jgi:diguanylate cyclase (GGDEF)-like protein
MVLAATDPTTILLWCGATAVLLFAIAGGFFAGVMAAPLLQDRAIRRASSQLRRMYKLVVEQVERAQRHCAEMASTTDCALTAEEWQRLDRAQRGFQETVARIAEACHPAAKPASTDAGVEKPRPQSFSVNWIKEPVDGLTGLPNHAAYDQNLAAMLAQVSETKLASGLLLVRMDKADSLRRRLGQSGVEKLLGRLASVVVRSARDEDLLCRVNGDTLALLCPSLPPLSGTKLSEKIREQVRSHRFRIDEAGPEVLVTASYGYASCSPGDSAELVRDRAADGLARSQSLGRNQLHVHDGEARALCRA